MSKFDILRLISSFYQLNSVFAAARWDISSTQDHYRGQWRILLPLSNKNLKSFSLNLGLIISFKFTGKILRAVSRNINKIKNLYCQTTYRPALETNSVSHCDLSLTVTANQTALNPNINNQNMLNTLNFPQNLRFHQNFLVAF